MTHPTLEEAVAEGELAQQRALEAADARWRGAAEFVILRMRSGARFIAEDVVLTLEDDGLTTHNAKAIGPIVARLGRGGFIRKTGAARQARTSHGSLKPIWERTAQRL